MRGHTPGPWFTMRNNFVAPHLVDVRDARVVWAGTWDVAWVLPFSDGDEGNADAALIAAAPDLLTALEYIANHLDGTPSPRPGDELSRLAEMARAAIAKAKP